MSVDAQPHVLVVEDDPATRALICEWLPDGVTHSQAASLQAARACIGERAPDVVVLDLLLPDGEGSELLHDIPRRAAVVAMSGSDRLLTEPGRVVSYLPKPFEPGSLQMLIRQALRAAAASR